MNTSSEFWVYILANRPRGVLYVGMTSALAQRIWQHRAGVVASFTRKFGVDRLVYFERHESTESAARREYALKRWRRAWKVALVEESNPDWRDLFDAIAG
ncbi:MAG: GIY-YIG nuclease family protein [Rhizobiales bacterium]|nr:GIY-YIG nuclease family protein [Hyphomicrobiales bacterium]